MDDRQLQTVWHQRQARPGVSALGEPLALLMKHTLGKKVRQLGALAAIWDEVIPESIAAHTALEGFQRGVLTVLVDSASHRFQLQTLLEGGLRQAIQERFSAGIRKIRLVPGQFASIDVDGSPRYEV
jgi:predicted nucleic acid-binding Zn ribbon protein